MICPCSSVFARSEEDLPKPGESIAPKDSLSFGYLSPSHAQIPTIILARLIESSAWKLNPIKEIKCARVTLAEAFSLNRSLLQRNLWAGKIT